MTSNAFGLIYTGENNPLLRDLAFSRSVAAVPFGGRYRCIDFVLSDMVNSGVTSVGLIAQKNYHSLMDHLGAGKEWDLVSATGAITANASGTFTINVYGTPTGFDNAVGYSWKIMGGTSVSGFSAGRFTVATNGTFGAAGDGGSFSVANVGNDIHLVFSPRTPACTYGCDLAAMPGIWPRSQTIRNAHATAAISIQRGDEKPSTRSPPILYTRPCP